jgi:hypothetical protein
MTLNQFLEPSAEGASDTDLRLALQVGVDSLLGR